MPDLFGGGGGADMAGEAEFSEEPDGVVVGVEFVPGEAVAGGGGIGVVVVVPAFSAGEQGDPPEVARVVAGGEAARSPHVGGGVDQPNGVQAEGDAEEDSPEKPGQAANGKEYDGEQGEREPVVAVDPEHDGVVEDLGGVLADELGLAGEAGSLQDPSDVGPPCAFLRRVRVSVSVGVLVMDAVVDDPVERSAFEGQGSADGEEVFEGAGAWNPRWVRRRW